MDQLIVPICLFAIFSIMLIIKCSDNRKDQIENYYDLRKDVRGYGNKIFFSRVSEKCNMYRYSRYQKTTDTLTLTNKRNRTCIQPKI